MEVNEFKCSRRSGCSDLILFFALKTKNAILSTQHWKSI